MKALHGFLTLVGVSAVVTLSSCAPDRVIGHLLASEAQTNCIVGCHDVDEYPDSMGVFIPGNIYQYDECTAETTDSDVDGLSDMCEYTLAHTFAPNLNVQEYDDVRNYAHWAARLEDGGQVIILYMLSYWEDGGDTGGSSFWCGGLVFHPTGCLGHSGDSEYIVETIKYNSTTKHWYLDGVSASTHVGERVWYPVNGELTTFEISPINSFVLSYEGNARTAPTIWVADGKHANYSTQTHCNDYGAIALTVQTNSDDCVNDRVLMPLNIGLQNERNFGSSSYHLLDRMAVDDTSHPDYASEATECYWTAKTLHGWWNSSSDVGQLNYSDVLSAWGF